MPEIAIGSRRRIPASDETLSDIAKTAAGVAGSNGLWPELQLVYQPPEAIKPAYRRLKRHSKRVVGQFAASIREFGFINPIIVDQNNQIVAGHGRWEAAKVLDCQSVPTICVDHLTPDQIRTYRIADNKLAEIGAWDVGALGLELAELDALEVQLETTGFSSVEIENLLVDIEGSTEEVDLPEISASGVAITREGDLWVLGRHRLYCGDALLAGSYEAILAGEKARMVFTDPPYNLQVDGVISGLGKHHREFVQGSGEMNELEFEAFLTGYMKHSSDASVDGAIHFHCIDWRHIKNMMIAGESVYGPPKQMCVWVKSNAGMGSFYRSQHELICIFKVGNAPHINTFGLGEGGRYRTNAWSYPGANAFGRNRKADLDDHPTVKPTVMVMDAIKDCSHRGEVILDPFGGSGTTLLAAEKTGRRARLIELDPLYVDVAVRRWQTLTGKNAVLAGDGRTYDLLALARVGEVTHGQA